MKLPVFNPFLPHLLTLAALLATPLSHAADGTWNGITGNWEDTTDPGGVWSGGTIADGVDSTANFTGVNITEDQIINLGAARTIGNITFTDLTTASNNLTISGSNILTLDRTSGVPIIDVTQTGRTLTISSQISGSDGLQKNGAGTLSLSGNNDYTGTTIISSGILAISSNNALGATSGNTTIAATGSNNGPRLTLSGGINSAENISVSGTTETGDYANVISSTSGTNTLSGNITLASPGTNGIRLGANGGNLILAGTINQTGTARTLILAATGGNITVNNAIANGTAALNIISQGSGGSVTLKAAQGAGGIGAVTIGEGGMLKLGVNDALRTNQTLTIGFTWGDKGTFDLAGFNQTVNGLVGVKNASLDSTRIVTNSAASGTSVLTVGNGNGSGTFNGVINDGATAAVALTKTGTGTQTLVGDSNYSGVTTISIGTLAITHGNALGSTTGNTTIAATGSSSTGGILSLSNNITSAENITITGVTESGGYASAIINTSGNNTLSGNINLNGTGGIRLGTASGSLTFSGNISQSGTSHGLAFSANSGTSITVNNSIALNGGALQVYSTGSVTLKGVNGVGGIGNTVISQSGTLKLGVTDALNTSGNLNIGVGATSTDTGTFDLAGYDQTVNAFNGVGTVASNSNRKVINSVAGTKTLTVGNGDGTGTFNGVILTGTGQVALVKTGSGTQTLNGTNTSTGGTRIDGGILALGHATDTLANTGAVNVNGGTLSIGGNSDTVGAVTLTSGSITGSGGTLTGTGSAYDVRSGSVSAKLGGSVGLTKTTAGTVTLSDINAYSGATNVNEGRLTIDTSGSINTSSSVTIAGGALRYNASTSLATTVTFTSGTLEGTNWNGDLSGLTIGSGQTISPGNSPGTAITGSQTWAGLGSYLFEINNATGGAGADPGWDLLTGSGTLDITATSGSPFNILLTSLPLGNIAGDAANFSDGTSYNWLFADFANPITGYASDRFFVNTTAFDNAFTGTFGVALGDTIGGGDNTQLYLTYTPIPEPRAALLGGIGLLLLLRRRRP